MVSFSMVFFLLLCSHRHRFALSSLPYCGINVWPSTSSANEQLTIFMSILLNCACSTGLKTWILCATEQIHRIFPFFFIWFCFVGFGCSKMKSTVEWFSRELVLLHQYKHKIRKKNINCFLWMEMSNMNDHYCCTQMPIFFDDIKTTGKYVPKVYILMRLIQG